MVDLGISPLMARSLLVGVGGALGALCRFWLGGALQARFGDSLPWATFAINITGSLALGVLIGLLSARNAPAFVVSSPFAESLHLALAVGFLGAYTTFSTFSLETIALVRAGLWQAAAGYVAASVLCGLLAVAAGLWLARAGG